MTSAGVRSQVQARVTNTLEKGIQIDLSTSAAEKYLRRNLKRKVPFVVMIADIDNSTKMTIELPPDQIARIINIFSQEASIIVPAYGGYVFKYEGDAVLALFPSEHDISAACRNAVLAARKILSVIEHEINPCFIQKNMPPISAKVSIDFGDLFVLLYGKKADSSYVDVVGFAIGAASKMLAVANSNSIIVGQSVYQNLRYDIAKDFAVADVDEVRWPYRLSNANTKYSLYSSRVQEPI